MAWKKLTLQGFTEDISYAEKTERKYRKAIDLDPKNAAKARAQAEALKNQPDNPT